MSPERRRHFVRLCVREYGVSGRRALKKADAEKQLIDDMLSIVRKQPRWGYRRVCDGLRREGWSVNHKRVFRLWQREGLRVPQKRTKRRSAGTAEHGIGVLEASEPNQVWAMDFVQDRCSYGKTLRWIMLIDEYTRECLQLEVGRRMNSADVRRLLLETIRERGAPEFVRSDNGPEFVAKEIRETLLLLGSNSAFIEAGAPWQNGYAESFNARFRDELLATTLFSDLREARALTATWKSHYNHDRPHSALGYATPAEFAAQPSEGLGRPATPTSPTPRSRSTSGTATLIRLS